MAVTTHILLFPRLWMGLCNSQENADGETLRASDASTWITLSTMDPPPHPKFCDPLQSAWRPWSLISKSLTVPAFPFLLASQGLYNDCLAQPAPRMDPEPRAQARESTTLLASLWFLLQVVQVHQNL